MTSAPGSASLSTRCSVFGDHSTCMPSREFPLERNWLSSSISRPMGNSPCCGVPGSPPRPISTMAPRKELVQPRISATTMAIAPKPRPASTPISAKIVEHSASHARGADEREIVQHEQITGGSPPPSSETRRLKVAICYVDGERVGLGCVRLFRVAALGISLVAYRSSSAARGSNPARAGARLPRAARNTGQDRRRVTPQCLPAT